MKPKLNILKANYKVAFKMFNLNPMKAQNGGDASEIEPLCCISERTSFFGEKALVIAARLPIMRPYQHGGTRQPDEPAS
ncbi:hypothetical protein GOY18_20630 [Aeromonas hydrophila]|uniref:hypothetical protein n=1 Tax=Aeromonas hydrophila TaxID=644 RepID=UPI001C5B08AB|nr:hypothetical protein [Aeromonas hydrophila]MBW3812565.1 hypothetical protein [Aeromonas hydrophila]